MGIKYQIQKGGKYDELYNPPTERKALGLTLRAIEKGQGSATQKARHTKAKYSMEYVIEPNLLLTDRPSHRRSLAYEQSLRY